MSFLSPGPDSPECSRAGCRSSAAWNVNWRNPRLHDESRVKVWLACDEHADWLRHYLASRGFPVIVTEFGESVSVVPDGAGAES